MRRAIQIRPIRLQVNLSEEEHADLIAEAHEEGLTLSDTIRRGIRKRRQVRALGAHAKINA